MTADDIRALPAGYHLDMLVAQFVMGYDGPQEDWPPPYSTDISAAWAIVEKIGLYFQLERRIAGGWVAAFGGVPVAADSAPHAISLAALLGQRRWLQRPRRPYQV